MQQPTQTERQRWLSVALLCLFTGLATLAWVQPVYAVDFPVTKTDDTADGSCDADCSLREAIIAANAAAGPDTITLPAGTYMLTIAGINEDFGATGDLDITGDLTINGAGEATTIIDGGAIDRVLHVLQGTVVINDVTIQNGDAFDLGGGIRNAGNLTVNSSTITDNNGWGGGGIYNSNADYTIATSDQPGGPTYNFIDISGTGTPLGLGSFGSTEQPIGFDFTFYGESYETLYVSSFGYLTFLENDLTDSSNQRLPKNDGLPISAIFGFWDSLNQGSGDIYVETVGSTPNRQLVVQYHNVTVGGTPIRFQIILSETSNTILLQYDDVATNPSTQGGSATVGLLDKEERISGIGYLYNQPILTDTLAIQFTPLPAAGDLTLDDVTLRNNNAVEAEGGGLFNNGIATVQNGTLVTQNTTESGGEGNGAGLANRNGTLTVQNSTVFSNTNSSDGNGAGISNFYGTTTIENTTIEANFTPDEDGSGVGLANAFGTMIVTSSVITDNVSESTDNTSGAGIHNLYGKLVISGTTVANNTLPDGNSGAGIQSIHGIVEITNSRIVNNSVGDSSSGAGIDAIKSRVIIDGSTIADNLNQSTFEDNINSDGGGIRINQGELVVTNSTISGNETTSGDGGGIAHISGGARPIAYTMFDNRFYDDGPSFNFTDISGSGTALNLGNDDSSLQSLGFDFAFYDSVETQVYVSSNGYLTFENIDTTSSNTQCSEDGVKSSIYGFWADLDPSAGGQIYVATQGSAPNRRFIVQYDNVPFNGDATAVTFQIVLVESTNQILFQYEDVEDVGKLMNDYNVVIGLDSPQRGDYDTHQAMRHYLTCGRESILPQNGLAIELTPAGGLTVVNSTISGNTAGATGGGIYFDGVITGGMASLINATIAFNDAPTGAGIQSVVSDTLMLTNTIVAGNTTGTDCAGGVLSGGYNLDSDGSCNLVATGDIPNGNAALGPLADNGGPTLTHLLLALSDAIDAGLDAVCQSPLVNNLDQRGFLRPQGGFCDIGAVEVSVPPAAVDDSYNTDEDTPLTVAAPGVLGNDVDSDPFTATLVSSVISGTLDLSVDGSFIYTPTLNASGVVTFTYVANDGTGNSNTATVTITVNAVNDAPVAVDESYSTDEDMPLTVTAPGILGNDSDVESDPLTVTVVSNVTNGTLSLSADGAFVYTPTANFNGVDTFTYVAHDGTADSNTATVTVTVNAVNDAPVAVDNSYSTNEDTALTVTAPGILGNDSDVDSDPLTATLVSNVTNGTLSLSADGSFVYTPIANFNGVDTFTYVANDGTVDSNTATVTVTVNAVNDAPVAVDDNYGAEAGVALTISAPGVLGNDSDGEGGTLTASLVTPSADGTVTLNSNGSFIFTPEPGFAGVTSFTYRASDGGANSNVATVTITVRQRSVLSLPTGVNGTPGSPVNLPLSLSSNGNAISSVVFSVDYDESCLLFDPTDANSDNIPDAITFNVPAGFTKSVAFDAADTDGELDFFISNITNVALTDGVIATLTFTVSSAPACASVEATVGFSSDPDPSFGTTSGASIPGDGEDGSVAIGGQGPVLGDCNADQQVDAGDITALVLEIFDGDGNLRIDAPGGTYPGNAACDANNDTVINAGDISCLVLLIFNGPGACGSPLSTSSSVAAPAQLVVTEQRVEAGATVAIPVTLEPGEEQITAVAVAFTFDPAALHFDPTDADNDKVPDAVMITVEDGHVAQVTYDATAGRLEFALFANRIDAPALAAGTLATITLTAHAEELGQEAITLVDGSLGNEAGQSVAVTLVDGTVEIVEAMRQEIYLPLIRR